MGNIWQKKYVLYLSRNVYFLHEGDVLASYKNLKVCMQYLHENMFT